MVRENSSEVILAIVDDETLKDRFNRYFDATVGEDKCWPWKGACRTIPGQEYGITTTKRVDNKPGKAVSTHRLALFFKTHLWPHSLCACHTCDNPKCVNPAHLYWGTDEDNTWDMVSRGRHGQQALTAAGRVPQRDYSSSNHRKPNRRLYKDAEQKVRIKREVMAANQEQLREIAKREEMSFGMCVAIKYGHTWKGVVV